MGVACVRRFKYGLVAGVLAPPSGSSTAAASSVGGVWARLKAAAGVLTEEDLAAINGMLGARASNTKVE